MPILFDNLPERKASAPKTIPQKVQGMRELFASHKDAPAPLTMGFLWIGDAKPAEKKPEHSETKKAGAFAKMFAAYKKLSESAKPLNGRLWLVDEIPDPIVNKIFTVRAPISEPIEKYGKYGGSDWQVNDTRR
jgi:hypothetical protein